MKRPSEEELEQGYNRYLDWIRQWNVDHNGEGFITPVTYDEWLETEYKNRFEVFVGFNTKQIWIEDQAFNVLIDPPKSVLESLPDWRDGNSDWEEKLYDILLTDPDWLYDREYWYDINMEV